MYRYRRLGRYLLTLPNSIPVEGKPYQTIPCQIKILNKTPALPERNPPIRFRKNIPTSWVELVLREGKNRQMRKMTAAVGFPTLRLVRTGIEKLNIEKMKSGEVQEISDKEILALLGL